MSRPAVTNLVSGPALAEVAAVMGDVGRATMLLALMDGRALTAGELARHAGVAPQTASAHLARLADLALVTVERQGRHRYHRLASPEVAGAVESLMALAGAGPTRSAPRAPATTISRDASVSGRPTACGRAGISSFPTAPPW